MIGVGVLLGIVLIVGLWVMSQYNGLVRRRNEVRNSFAQIDVQLKRRYDLIPNLVETVKGALAHEKETLDAVISARNAALPALRAVQANPADAHAMKQLAGTEATLSGALGRLLAVSEAYPDLKGVQAVRDLTEELSSTENRIAFARQAYNDAVMVYNTARESFPAVIVANNFGFAPAQGWEIERPIERENVKVSFGKS